MTWWHRLWHRKRMETQLEKELRFHLDQHVDDLVARGHTPEEARRLANLALGGSEQVKEGCRDARGTRWFEDLYQDTRYALRALRQKPGFAAIALLTLALGSGATTIMFTVIDNVLLKPLPFPNAERLVSLHETTANGDMNWAFAYLNFADCRSQSRSFAAMAAWKWRGGTISEPGVAEYFYGRQISSDLFSVYGIPLLHGRSFSAEEDRPGGTPVAIISYKLWENRFGSKPEAIGAKLIMEGKVYTVVGVAPFGFRLSGDVDIFTPIGQDDAPIFQSREIHPGIQVVARLQPGVTNAQAQQELTVIGNRLAKAYPKSNEGRSFHLQPLHQEIVGNVRPTLLLLLGAVGMVLLIACVNVASLMLARAVSRDRELAMRVALGASRGRLIRQCLTESALLALLGGILGASFAVIGTKPFLFFWPGGLPRAEEIHFDWRILLFTLGLSLLSGLLFGLAPALRAPAREPERVLRTGSRTVIGNTRYLHNGFVISEITLAIVLLISAGMLGQTLLRLSSLDPGIDTRNVMVSNVSLSGEVLTTPDRIRAAWHEIFDRVRQISTVQAVAIADIVPMSGNDDLIGYWTTPTTPPANQIPMSLMNLVTPDYLRAMGIPLLQGRFFTDQDRLGNETVIVIDEVMAKKVFGNREPVGNQLWLQFLGAVRVIGVVRHVRHWGLDADDRAAVREQIYLPFAQLPDSFLKLTASGMSLIVRTSVPPLTTVEAIRQQVRGVTRDQAMYEVRTMEQIVKASLARQRFLCLLFGIFAGLALLLACIGIYGVLAYLTSQRVPEMGVRMALGASTSDILQLILRQSLRLIAAGIVIGALVALGAGQLLERLIEGMEPTGPLTFIAMTVLLSAAALLASYIPARRASRIDPMTALRQD